MEVVCSCEQWEPGWCSGSTEWPWRAAPGWAGGKSRGTKDGRSSLEPPWGVMGADTGCCEPELSLHCVNPCPHIPAALVINAAWLLQVYCSEVQTNFRPPKKVGFPSLNHFSLLLSTSNCSIPNLVRRVRDLPPQARLNEGKPNEIANKPLVIYGVNRNISAGFEGMMTIARPKLCG